MEDDSELDELEVLAVSELKGKTINEHIVDVESLQRSAEEIREERGDFLQHLSLSTESIDDKLKDDDLQREAAFVEAARQAAEEGLAKLVSLNVPFRRPDDYFAEMIKSDTHMEKVRVKLQVEKGRIDAAVKRRTERENSKNMKKRQRAKEQERKKREKDEIAKLEKDFRQQKIDREVPAKKGRKRGATRENRGGSDDDDLDGDNFPVDVLDAEEISATSIRRKKSDRSSSRGPSAKRRAKDDKFGRGGRKRGSKRNDESSAADDKGFSVSRNRREFGGIQKKRGKAAPKKRPGKERRRQLKSKNR
mmetsp:Transcript_8914/g.26767  ORF Transcript_8914/g.26767 Transcript_8914/m.26767 type:complete len:306 (+) Transcript_8914:76-993(+)